MSIEMENPQSPREITDAARNWNAQIRIAATIGDHQRVEMCVEKIDALMLLLESKLPKES